MKLKWFSPEKNRWYSNKFTTKKQMDRRIQFLKDRNVKFVIEEN